MTFDIRLADSPSFHMGLTKSLGFQDVPHLFFLKIHVLFLRIVRDSNQKNRFQAIVLHNMHWSMHDLRRMFSHIVFKHLAVTNKTETQTNQNYH